MRLDCPILLQKQSIASKGLSGLKLLSAERQIVPHRAVKP